MVASGMLEIDQARRLVLAAVRPLPAEPVQAPDALGRVLAEDIAAEQPVPAFDGSAMDGFAVRAADVASAAGAPVSLAVVGESRAGAPADRTLDAGQAIAISTGAVIPSGADAVVRVEDATRHEDTVDVHAAVAVAEHVRRAGEDISAGQTVLRRGTLLGPAELGVLASLGRGAARCARRPRLSVLVSGDELLTAGEATRPGAVRDSNTPTISALATLGGAQVSRTAHMPDDPAACTAAIEDAIEDVEVAVICGGVSVGAHDHVRPSLHELGALEEFWGLALKPGHPTWFGTHGSTLIFGLPGNPVSAMVTFILLVRPALRALLGLAEDPPRPTAVLEHDYAKAAGRAHAARCRLSVHEDGWHAAITAPQGSHILTSMLGADALAMIPSDVTSVRAGERVEIEPLAMRAGAWA